MVRHYISAHRFYQLSQGIGTPGKLPALADQLIIGTCKQLRGAHKEVSKKTKRAISMDMLKLLEHSIAIQDSWSIHKKSPRWSVVLVAWWGSFRIGELLLKLRHQFDAKKDLLVSDVKFY